MAECPWEALRDPTLPDGAKTVLSVLWRRAGSSGRFVWPKLDTLAFDCGMKPRTLRKHLATLRDRAWISNDVDAQGRRGWTLRCAPAADGHTVDSAGQGERHEHAAGTNVPVQTGQTSGKNVPRERHERASGTNVPARTCHASGTNVPDGRQERAAGKNVPARTCRTSGKNVPVLLIRNQRHEPMGGGFSQDLEQRGANEPPPPPPSVRTRGPNANAWRVEFAAAWHAHTHDLPCRISDPTHGAAKVVELQRMLDEHGGDVVRDVLLHAAAEVARHHDSGGRHGIHPAMLGVVFRADRPQAFDARLDAWQRDKGRQRRSGKMPAAPPELDGIALTDDEQRVWMAAMGDAPERAVREHREVMDARALVAAGSAELLGFGGAR